MSRIATFLDGLAAVTPRRTAPLRQRKIAVMLFWGVGDAVLTLPFLRRLRAAYPAAEITLIGKPFLEDLFAGEGLADRTISLIPPWTRHQGKYRLWSGEWRQFLRHVARLRREDFDLLVSLRPDPRETLLGRLLAVRAFAGYGTAGGRGWISVDLAVGCENEPTLYRGELAARAADRLLGGQTDPKPVLSRGIVPTELRIALAEAGYAGGPILAISFAAAHPIRRWSGDRISDVLHRLRHPPGALLIIDEGSAPHFVAPQALPTVRWSAGLGELKNCLAAADLLFCTDSGVMHIAAAIGCPTVALFGPGSPARFAPRSPGAVTYLVEPMPCRPCHDYCHFPTPLCMDSADGAALAGLLDRALANVTALVEAS